MRKFNPSMLKRFLFAFVLLVGWIRPIGFSQNLSPLQQGKWIKIAVTQSQFYRINQAWFNKHQIPVEGPDKISIWGSKSGMIDPNEDEKIGLLKPIPTSKITSNNTWEVLFWGDSPHPIKQVGTWGQQTNLYSDTTFYFVQIDATKPNLIEEISPKASSGTGLSFAYGIKHYEPETYNLLQSGQNWLGDAFYGSGNKFLQYSLNDYAEGKPAYLEAKFYSSSLSASSFTFPNLGKNLTLNPISGGRYDTKASSETIKTWISPTLSSNAWTWPIQFQSSGGTGYIDYITLVYPRNIDAKNTNPLYLLPNSSDSTINIDVPNLTSQQQIWVNNGGTQWYKIVSNKSFQLNFQTNSRLAIADINLAGEPILCGNPENQSALTIPAATEMLVISSPTLQKEAKKLAVYKTNERNLSSIQINTSAIYQDFSGGKQDVTAIRNFIRYQYQKTGSKLKYVILFGDASIDYKGQNVISTSLEKACFVPTYQSKESLQPLLSYASDDFYGIVGPNAQSWQEGLNVPRSDIQVAIGRIPVKNPQEANMFVNKLIDFESKPRTRPTQFAWLADDGDANIHMQDAEDFAKLLLNGMIPGQQHKIYLDQYPFKQNNGFFTSPLATQATLDLFEQKADFIHYTGHGSESGLADEKLLTTNDLVSLKNNNNLPILLTATCQFGRFDDPNILSGGEVSLLSDQGGAIALISTTRPVFQSSNYLFGQAFYQSLIKNRNNPAYRLGDIFRDAKNQSQSGVINRNIQLLGDPSLSLPWSSANLKIELDSIKQELNVSGEQISNEAFTVQLHRIGEPKTTLGNKGLAYSYQTMSPIIWKSSGKGQGDMLKFSLKNMPSLLENQAYQLTIWSRKASGSIPVASWKNKQKPDLIAPKITMNLVDESSQSISNNPNIQISFADSSGLSWLNSKGEIAYLVVDDSIRIELAPNVQLKSGNSTLGEASIRLSKLNRGKHKILVFCWDIYNNYAQETLEFQINDDDQLASSGKIYPNPLSRSFHFVFGQDKPWNRMPFEMELTNINGQLILRKSGFSNYLESKEGMIAFDWTEDEWQKLNSMMIIKISLFDELQKEMKIFTIKTSTLK